MTSVRTLMSAALCAVVVAGAAVAPASAEPFHAGWRGGGWHDRGWRDHGWGGRALAFGGLGLATGALIGAAASRPAYYNGPACGRTVSTHTNARGELVKVVSQNPC